MGKYDIDKELYIKWCNEKTPIIENMTLEVLDKRIEEVSNVEFWCKAEWALLSKRRDVLTGRKGISPLLKEERNRLITEPDIKVNFNGEPRKKEKKSKLDLDLKNLLGVDMAELTQRAKDHKKGKLVNNTVENENDSPVIPTPVLVTKLTEEEKQQKADALREKMRLAKEALANKKV